MKQPNSITALTNNVTAWSHKHGYQVGTCRIPDTQSHNSENTSTTGRDNAIVVWRERIAPRTLLFRDAADMDEHEFVRWLLGEQQKEVAA